MALLPYLGETDDTKNWSELQLNTFAASTYLIIAMLIALLALALTNLFRHIVKRGRLLMHPLLRFYVFMLLCLMSSGIFVVYLIAIDMLILFPLIVTLPPTFKMLLGIEQVWMMLELAIRIRQCNAELTYA